MKVVSFPTFNKPELSSLNRAEIGALWKAGFDTCEIGRLLNLPEYMVANGLPEIRASFASAGAEEMAR